MPTLKSYSFSFGLFRADVKRCRLNSAHTPTTKNKPSNVFGLQVGLMRVKYLANCINHDRMTDYYSNHGEQFGTLLFRDAPSALSICRCSGGPLLTCHI